MLRRGIIICTHPSKFYTSNRLKLLETRHHVSIISQQNRQDLVANFLRLTAERPYQAVVFYPGYINPAIGKWDKELFSSFGESLRLVIGAGAGYDHVDMEHLTKIGAHYANAPVSVSEPTATTTVTLILQTIRATTQAEISLRKGQWARGLEPTDDIRDLTIGIVGYGTIGQVSTKLKAPIAISDAPGSSYNQSFEPWVQRNSFITTDTVLLPRVRVISTAEHFRVANQLTKDENGAIYSSLDQVLSGSDLVTLHCPLTPETRHLLSDRQFAMMKHGAYIVNTSRGPVIDEGALARAMKSGQISRVGLDVFENEPEVHPYLMTSERATLLPHWGSKVKRVFYDIEHECLDNLDCWLEKGVPITPVNKPAFLVD